MALHPPVPPAQSCRSGPDLWRRPHVALCMLSDTAALAIPACSETPASAIPTCSDTPVPTIPIRSDTPAPAIPAHSNTPAPAIPARSDTPAPAIPTAVTPPPWPSPPAVTPPAPCSVGATVPGSKEELVQRVVCAHCVPAQGRLSAALCRKHRRRAQLVAELLIVPGVAREEGEEGEGQAAVSTARPGEWAAASVGFVGSGATWVRVLPPATWRKSGIDYKTTTILLDGRRVKLELWDTSGQGRFCTIFRSYSRGAQGILLVYDITNRWSFDGIDRWIKEIDEHAPGVPRILVGNRLHLAFKRQVPTEQARAYAEKNGMTFFEVSPLCNFNVIESFTELSRIVLMRHGMEKIWRPNRVFSLQDLCCRAIVSCTPVHLIDKLPLPVTIKSHLKSFSMANGMNAVMMHGRSYSLASGAGGSSSKGNSLKRSKSIRPPQSPPQNCSRSNCKIS
eukprot:XP_005622162.1 ras-related protein Rab-40C [Canis lupus familiaris]